MTHQKFEASITITSSGRTASYPIDCAELSDAKATDDGNEMHAHGEMY